MSAAQDFHKAAQAWLDSTNGATLPVEVIDRHPALEPLLVYAEEEMGLAPEEADDLACTLLRQVTRADDGALLWRHEGREGVAADYAEWRDTRASLAESGIGQPPEEHDERHAFELALLLLDDHDQTLAEVRGIVKASAIEDAKFTGEEPPMPSNVVPLRPAPDKPKPKTKQDQWLEALMEDDDVALARAVNTPMIIEDTIPGDSLGFLFGQSGVGKSFVAMSMAHSAATGRPWLGDDNYAVEQPGLVIYVAAEGAGGVRKRKAALEQETGIKAPLLRILPAAPMMDGPDGHLLSETLKELERRSGKKVAMVIFDTLNQTASGDENSNTDMGAFVNGCKAVKRNGAAVIIVHHSGLSDDDRMRGASALKGAADFEFAVKGSTEGTIAIHHKKSKDEETWRGALMLKARKVTIDGLFKRNGDPVRTLVVEPASMADQLNAASKLTPNERTLLEVIQGLADESGAGISTKDEARKAFYEAKGDSGASARQAFNRALKSLCERQMVFAEDDDLRLELEVSG